MAFSSKYTQFYGNLVLCLWWKPTHRYTEIHPKMASIELYVYHMHTVQFTTSYMCCNTSPTCAVIHAGDLCILIALCTLIASFTRSFMCWVYVPANVICTSWPLYAHSLHPSCAECTCIQSDVPANVICASWPLYAHTHCIIGPFLKNVGSQSYPPMGLLWPTC